MEENIKKPNVSFNGFLEMFPTIQLPVTLNDELARTFSANNEPLPALAIEQFIPWQLIPIPVSCWISA